MHASIAHSNGDLNPKNVARKERAVYMLLKLLSRHTAAEIYIRRNIERLISKSVSKVIRSGRTCALLDLLNIVNCCKDQFPVEMSQYNFNGRGIEMMVQEVEALLRDLCMYVCMSACAYMDAGHLIWKDNFYEDTYISYHTIPTKDCIIP